MNAKSIKEFFRPTKIKIRITLFLVVLFLSLIISSLFSVYISPGCCHTYIYTPFQYFVIHLLALFSENLFSFSGLLEINIMMLLIAIISNIFLFTLVLYSFSCLFDFLYNSFGKSKHKKTLRICLVIITLIFIAFPIAIEECNESRLKYFEEENLFRNFQDTCGDYCKNTNSLEYCTYYFKYNNWNRNNQTNELVDVGYLNWDACESRIYCFLIYPCEKRFGKIPIEGCSKALCEKYLEKYNGDVALASKEIRSLITETGNSTKCNLNEIPEISNWHKRYFPENVCEKYINNTKE